jgi:hypothetical protein
VKQSTKPFAAAIDKLNGAHASVLADMSEDMRMRREIGRQLSLHRMGLNL